MVNGFRKSLFGFNRKDVVRYIEGVSRDSNHQLESYNVKITDLSQQISFEERKNAELQAKLDQCARDLEFYKQQIDKLDYDNMLLRKQLIDFKNSKTNDIDLQKELENIRMIALNNNESFKKSLLNDIKEIINEQNIWCDFNKSELERFVTSIQSKLQAGAECLKDFDYSNFDRMKLSISSVESKFKFNDEKE